MSRRIAAVNGVHANGDAPPPSTLAAQIVQNQTRPSADHQKRGGAPTFAELLHEILHNQAATIETDVATNVKLISVVAEAGLVPLADRNPFAQQEDLISQGVDSITVIESTIKRQPDVLFTAISQNGPPPLLPLLARLFAVCGRPGCEDLPVARLLDSIFKALDASLDLCHYAQILLRILQRCITEVVTSLESSTNPSGDFLITLPAARSISKLWPESEKAIALPHGLQTTLDVRAHAFMLALELSDLHQIPPLWKHEAQQTLQKLALDCRSSFLSSEQWSATSLRLLAIPNCVPFLTHILQVAYKEDVSPKCQALAARALIRTLRRDKNAARDQLLPQLLPIASNEVFDTSHEDLRIAITTTVSALSAREEWSERVQALHDALRQDNVMTDSELQAAFRELTFHDIATYSGHHRKKRRRIDVGHHQDRADSLIRKTTKLLTGVESQDLHALPEVAPNVYQSLSEDDQCAAWQALIELSSIDLQTSLQAATRLIETSEIKESKHARVLVILAIRACIEKTTDATYLDLGRSMFGQLCLRSLQSSVREIRIAAGQCLECFLRGDLSTDLMESNRKAAIDRLRSLSRSEVACEQETLVSSWRQIGTICGETELNLALDQLVDYLGHPNPFICGIAFTELERLAVDKSISTQELFKPFWGTIAYSVVRDLNSRPQKAQQLCDLLGMDLVQFLVLTQQETIPTLVLTKKKEVLERIATACGHAANVRDLLLQPRTNLMATLSLLLARTTQEAEETAMECLVAVAPSLADTDIASLVKIDAILLACNMLKDIGDQSQSRKSRAYQAFSVFAGVASRGPGQSKSSRHPRVVAEFFDIHILGIMTHFSEILENTQAGYTKREKVRCVRAITEMIVLANKQIAPALPQIRAALQSAMDNKDLTEAAFPAWLNLLSVLDGEGIALIVEQTFALILRHWSALSTEMRQLTHEKIGTLVKEHNQVLQENIMTLPSLKSIKLLSKVASEIERLKAGESVEVHCKAFTKRLRNENSMVVLQALQELPLFLTKSVEFIHDSATSEQPGPVLPELLRALLDATVKYASDGTEAADLCGQALGIIGCVDPNRIEATRGKRRTLVLSNFDRADEVINWAIVLLEDVLVKAFKSVTNARAQGFLAYVMQELLAFCGFTHGAILKARTPQEASVHQKWLDMSEHVRITLTPFVSSRYVVTSNAGVQPPSRAYPSFAPDAGHASWLRSLVYDLMWKAKGENAQMVFPLLARTIRGHDLAIASFMLPYVLLNVVLGGTVSEVKGISDELLAVLNCDPVGQAQEETVKLCSESVFSVLDYMSTWLQEKKKVLAEHRAEAYKTGRSQTEVDEIRDVGQIQNVEQFLTSVPAEVVATRAVMCGSYARALFNWEQYIRRERPLIPSTRPPQQFSDDEMLYEKLQEIYAEIDEPDGLEGISAHLRFLTEEQAAMQHAKAGRWTAAQAWYELQLAEHPEDADLEERVLSCFRGTGRYEPLLRYADSFMNLRIPDAQKDAVVARLLPSVLEAQWMIGDLEGLKTSLATNNSTSMDSFNARIAKIITAIDAGDKDAVVGSIQTSRSFVAQSMTLARTNSLQACHDDMVKLHILQEIEMIANADSSTVEQTRELLDRRLSVIGSYVADKQSILALRRVAMQPLDTFGDLNIGSAWLTTAKLARQAGNTEHAYNAVIKASECGDKGAKIEEARLLWRDGHQRHAIHALETAMASGMFEMAAQADANQRPNENLVVTRSTSTTSTTSIASTTTSTEKNAQPNVASAKVHLLLAKWLDRSGQSQSNELMERYQKAAKDFARWEKGHYYLGRHYQKLLDAEKVLPKEKQGSQYQSGELSKLVVENLVRSVPFGDKYWHQTIPKILTLWLDLGLQTVVRPRHGDQAFFDARVSALSGVHRQLRKYFERVPPFVFYSAMPQMISRISHPNPEVWKLLSFVLVRIASAHPSQALWNVLAVVKATDRIRVERGLEIINRLKDPNDKAKSNSTPADLRDMIARGQKLSDALLKASEVAIDKHSNTVRLSIELGFNRNLAPSQLVVPIEATLSINLPNGASHDMIKRHKAFVQNKITIQSFDEEVLVLTSLQRPRKLTLRGSDGKKYGLLCKPKDDLRKDRRLMEFNGIINRVLKRDAESSKRHLYIKTYAVTPLSEESGIIEWVEGIKPIRDILLKLYDRKSIKPNYPRIKVDLDRACQAPEHAHIFIDEVLGKFPAVLHEWFHETYPEPDAWFAARLRYARTAAVMSMVGHVLGLGDRHGENILLEEGTGGVFHVDFNCLFDKGRTFEKPELVPFRLTQNMVDAMGPYGYEGPFRKSCELALRLLRQSKDTLMTILETFLYDPTTDFVGQKKKRSNSDVPDTPQEILDGVEAKLKGLLRGEKVPLGVEGYVDALIREAVNPFNLASMYIGWCAWL